MGFEKFLAFHPITPASSSQAGGLGGRWLTWVRGSGLVIFNVFVPTEVLRLGQRKRKNCTGDECHERNLSIF